MPRGSHKKTGRNRRLEAAPAGVYHVGGDDVGRTLAAVVRRNNAGMSWGEANRLVKARHVEANGNLATDPARRLSEGEVVRLHAQPRQPLPDLDDLSLAWLDEHLAVVDKPARVTSVRERRERGMSRQRRQLQPTLDEMLQELVDAEFPEPPTPAPARGRGRGAPERPRVRPVHRLDRDTSGLMVFALSPLAESELVAAFKKREVGRSYLAVVHGHPEAMTVQSHLVRDRGDGKRGSLPAGASPKSDRTARHAVTHVEPLRAVGDDRHLVRCRLETGRTHQIRIHLAERGFPLLGDRLYGRRDGFPRQALHAAELTVTHPATGERLGLTCDLPDDLARLVAQGS